MSWKKIIKEDFKDEMYFIAVNGDSFISGKFDNADLRFGINQSTFGKIRDLARKHKGKAYDSMTVQKTKNGVVVDFKMNPHDGEMEDAFDLLAMEIEQLLRNSKYIKQTSM